MKSDENPIILLKYKEILEKYSNLEAKYNIQGQILENLKEKYLKIDQISQNLIKNQANFSPQNQNPGSQNLEIKCLESQNLRNLLKNQNLALKNQEFYLQNSFKNQKNPQNIDENLYNEILKLRIHLEKARNSRKSQMKIGKNGDFQKFIENFQKRFSLGIYKNSRVEPESEIDFSKNENQSFLENFSFSSAQDFNMKNFGSEKLPSNIENKNFRFEPKFEISPFENNCLSSESYFQKSEKEKFKTPKMFGFDRIQRDLDKIINSVWEITK